MEINFKSNHEIGRETSLNPENDRRKYRWWFNNRGGDTGFYIYSEEIDAIKFYVKPKTLPQQVVVSKNGGVYELNLDELGYYQENCTGAKDENEKLIYEGDTDGRFVVEWWITGFGAREIKTGRIYHLITDGFIVVGNINENPELLIGMSKE